MKKRNIDRACYPAVFTYEEGQEIAVVFPDLDVATSGVDDRDALLSARECLGMVLCGLEEDGEQIPNPTHLTDIKAGKNERVVLIDAFLPSYRMANNNKAVNRTVTLPAWLNALALENGLNFSQVLQEGIKSKLGLL